MTALGQQARSRPDVPAPPVPLLEVRRELPDAGTGLILGRPPTVPEIAARTSAARADAALCGIAGLTADGVADLHERGFQVTAWPIPDEQALATAAELAVDGLTTDHPDRICTPAKALLSGRQGGFTGIARQ